MKKEKWAPQFSFFNEYFFCAVTWKIGILNHFESLVILYFWCLLTDDALSRLACSPTPHFLPKWELIEVLKQMKALTYH